MAIIWKRETKLTKRIHTNGAAYYIPADGFAGDVDVIETVVIFEDYTSKVTSEKVS